MTRWRWIIKADGSDKIILPIGTIQMYAGDTIPQGWLACEGQECPIEYEELALLLNVLLEGQRMLWPVIPDLRGKV